MDLSQMTFMSEQYMIRNFGRVGANIDELFNRIVVTIMPVIDRLTAAEAEQNKVTRSSD